MLPGTFGLLTRRCTQRQFLLRPDAVTNQIVLYCLAIAAARFAIEVLLPSVMSNHHHIVLFDRLGLRVQFTEHFHKLVARAMNAYRKRGECFWSSDPPSFVELGDRAAVIDKLVYAAANPVQAGLVERVAQWPGVNGLAAFLDGRTLTVPRPRYFFSPDGDLPEVATITLAIPEELGDAEAVRREVRERVTALEAAQAAARARTGARVVGRRAVRRQSWRSAPATPALRGRLRPRVAARDAAIRFKLLDRMAWFQDGYRHAREAWLAGQPATFPAGTYWLARFANVTVAAA